MTVYVSVWYNHVESYGIEEFGVLFIEQKLPWDLTRRTIQRQTREAASLANCGELRPISID